MDPVHKPIWAAILTRRKSGAVLDGVIILIHDRTKYSAYILR